MYKKILENIKKYDEEVNQINANYKKAVEGAKQYANPYKDNKIKEAEQVKKEAMKTLHDSYKDITNAYYEELQQNINKTMGKAPSQDALNSLLLLKARKKVSQNELNAYASLSKNYSCFNLLNEIAEANGLQNFYKEVASVETLKENANDIMKMTEDFYDTRGTETENTGYDYKNALLLNGSMLEKYEENYNNFVNSFTDTPTTDQAE